MFCLLLSATKCKQQQIAILIISFFLYVDGIRNEGNNMLQQQQQHQQQQPIENSNYQSSSASTNSIFRPSPLLEFTLADATISNGPKPSVDISSNSFDAGSTSSTNSENLPLNSAQPSNNRRYSTSFTNGEQQYPFSNGQQGFLPQQQQQLQQYQEDQQFTQQLTEMPIYIYKDPSTNENYHYTPKEPSPTYNQYHGYGGGGGSGVYQHQPPHYQPTTSSTLQDNQEYLVHSSMLVGQQAYEPSRKDIYQKHPGLVYDESYISHPNAVVDKKDDNGAAKKPNKISYDSHDYPPPSYHQQHTSNFLPTPTPEIPPTPGPTAPPIRATPPPRVYYSTPRPPVLSVFYEDTPSSPPVRPPPSYATPRPPTHSQDYKPRPPPQPPLYGQQQPYLQSSQNVLPNYANNVDNYLANKQQTEYYRPSEYPTQQYETIPPPHRQQYQQQTSYPPFGQQPSQPPQYQTASPSRPSYNNYYDYQIGEIPPQSQGGNNYPYPRPPPQYTNGPYRPPYVPPPTTPQPSGLATLVQYAPQFTSLLLGGGGGSSANTNSPLGSLLGALAGANSPQSSSPSSSSSTYNRRPINSQLIKALENIARNDDLQCVPKVVCQMIAGQTQRGQLPSFITSPTITNFLAAFPTSSPALIYGRAALLGISGGERVCHNTYVKCPKNEIEIINYLNNHRGGFFKFFSEPEDQSVNQQNGNLDSFQSGATSLLNILSALTGTPQETVTTPRPRPKPQPAAQPAATDITETIGNFFTNLLSDYMGEGASVVYQRRRKRSVAEKRVRFEDKDDENFSFSQESQDYNDEEDTEDTEKTVEFVYEPEDKHNEDDDAIGIINTEARVVHRDSHKGNRLKFFPESANKDDGNEDTKDDILALVNKFNELNKGRKLKFPSTTAERQYVDVAKEYLRDGKQLNDHDHQHKFNYGHKYTNYQEETFDQSNDSNKSIKFYNDPEEDGKLPFRSGQGKEIHDLHTAASNHVAKKIKFPEREGKILNRPYYAASYSYNRETPSGNYGESEDKFVVSNHQRPYTKEENDEAAEQYNTNELGPNDYNSYHPPERPENYYDYNQSQGPTSNVYNTHITSLSSNYLSNSNTNHNYYTSPWPQDHSAAGNSNKGTANYFLPTPAPDTDDIDKDYNRPVYKADNNQHSVNGNYRPYTIYESNKSQRYTSASSSSGFNRQIHRPNRRPIYNSNQSSNSNYISSKYPSNSYSGSSLGNDRYHSSHYINRRSTTTTTTTTTPRPRNDNIYVTNSRGETEYYIRPDGRKVYL
ncbi:uncharacterized protein LOC142236242 [Haematobia irritans]|uniref:uncharacterized protein LOC142236242 n=1 Tax=Haematobia irritans TaxID=7368 RepID=UPI003F4F9C5E